MSHRLFFGIRPPRTVREALLCLMHGIDNARWQDDEQLHLTLHYIGEVEAHTADDIAEAASLIGFQPFLLEISGLGVFERKGSPSALWAGISQNDPLDLLQAKLERLCQASGVPAERRKFVPHITLARLNQSSGPVGPILQQNARLKLEPWLVEEFVLFESTLHPEGSIYTPVVTYSIRRS